MIFALSFGFFFTGMVVTLLGPILPVLAAKAGLSDAQSGALFTAQFVASLLGVAASAWFGSRVHVRNILLGGYIMQAVGVGAYLSDSLPGIMAGAALSGLGFGATMPKTNLVVAELSGSAALNVLNAAWGLGAVSWPLFATIILQRSVLRNALIPLSGFLLVAGFLIYVRLKDADVQVASSQPNVPAGTVDMRAAALVGLIMFLYVGVETSLAGWLPTFLQRLNPASEMAASATSPFWGALLASRFSAPFILRRIGDEKFATAGLLIALSGVVGCMVARTPITIMLCGAVAGLGLGPVFPNAISHLSRQSGLTSGWKTLLFGTGGLGGASVPAVFGAISDRTGNLRLGILFTGATLLCMLVVRQVLLRRDRLEDRRGTGAGSGED
jgi:FHS family glucose/mannose:H+ symporter-like MFS transporter